MGNSTPPRVMRNGWKGRGFLRWLLRKTLRVAGRIILWLFARVKITGQENFPQRGPLIMAGNHAGLMEVVLMAIYPPFEIEFVGSGDIPLDPKFAWIAQLWGFIPVKRGNLDRVAIYTAVDVLNSKRVIALFPEGGIWDPMHMEARLGIALISGLARSPVLPIGFGGIQGALRELIQFKRPRLEINIGSLNPPTDFNHPELSRKQVLEVGARHILDQIQSLVPAQTPISNENFQAWYELEIKLAQSGEAWDDEGEAFAEQYRAPVAKLLLHPVIMDIFVRNLRLPVDALIDIRNVQEPGRIASAISAVLEYLETNPGFFTYRFGMTEGLVMQQGLFSLYHLANRVSVGGKRLLVHPMYIQYDPLTGEKVITDVVKQPNEY